MATKTTTQKAQRIYAQLQKTTDALTRKDLANWRTAWQMAINVDNPNRVRLYDIYNDAIVDAHLSGCITQRTNMLLARPFTLIDRQKKEPDKEITHLLDQVWFTQLCRYCLESIYFGYSLVELGDPTTDADGCISLTGVTLIPRKHVIPEYHRAVVNVNMDWHSGIDYKQPPYNRYLIEAGDPYDLGLLLKAALQTIPKKNMASFWDTFGEIFGMPMRIAKTTSRDPKTVQELNDMLTKGASSLSVITGADTDIQFVEAAKGDAFNVYDKRIDRANSELSKLIIGQTMTIEDGSSLSQSQTHLEVFENIIKSDAVLLRNIINNQLLPKLTALGFPFAGYSFEWTDAKNYTPEQQIAYETMIADRFEVDAKYFIQKYNMPITGKKEVAQPAESEQESESKLIQSQHFFD